MVTPLLGAIEAGGTEFVCAVAEKAGTTLIARHVIPTTSPAETLSAAVEFLSAQPLRAVGVGCFGPVDLDAGRITTTPKPGWRDVEVVGMLHEALQVPIGFDTDVNAAALGEGRHGAGRGRDPLIYVTIGTGIGAGVIVGERPVHGLLHPEAGHMSIRRNRDDLFAGSCPFHSDCLEGLASGPAIAARWGSHAEDLAPGHPAWKLEATYLAEAMCNMIVMLSPERIVLGGGVMNHKGLLPMIHREVLALLGGYLAPLDSPAKIEDLIVEPALGDDAGIVGALELARQAA